MTQARAKKIEKAIGLLKDAISIVYGIREDEQEKYDNMSDRSQDGERGMALMDEIEGLASAEEDMESVVEALTNMIQYV